MIRRLKDFAEGAQLQYDVCIVGSGPAGLVACAELAERGLRVCVLESGLETPDLEVSSLKEVQSANMQIRDSSRERVFGGTSSTWSGLSALFDDVDFDRSSLHKWPIKRRDITKYLNIASERYGFPPISLFAEKVSGFNWHELEEKLFVDAKSPQRFASDLKHLFRLDGIDLYLGANAIKCISAVVDGAERVTGIQCVDELKRGFLAKANIYILACGAIENARLMLNSPAATSGTLGNRHDQVGRYFMNHPKGYGALVHLHKPYRDLSKYFRQPLGAFFRYAGLRLKEATQRGDGVLNAYARIEPLFPWTDRPEISSMRKLAAEIKGSIKELARFNLPDRVQLSDMARRLLDVPAFMLIVAARLPYLNSPYPRNLRVRYFAEMEPRSENRIILAQDRKDRFGIPIPVIDYDLSASDRIALENLHSSLKREFERLGIGKMVEIRDRWVDGIRDDASHHLGGTRMGEDPRSSVVDQNLKVHGVENLYISGGSVFPTSGCANPTYTIVALSVRLAHYVAGKFARKARRFGRRRPSGSVKVMLIGAGRRILGDVLPAFESLGDRYSIRSVFARRGRAIFGREAVYQAIPLDKMKASDVEEVGLVYVAVPHREVPSVIARLASYSCSHAALVIDTPVSRFSGYRRLFGSFKSVWVGEDSPTMPWIETVKLAQRKGGMGSLRDVRLDRSVFRYHGVALIKALCGAEGYYSRIRFGFKFLSRICLYCNDIRCVVHEPRDYSSGRMFLTFDNGRVSDRSDDGNISIQLLREGRLCVGLRIDNVETRLTREESALIGELDPDDTVITRMVDFKRVGLARLLRLISDGACPNVESGMDDAAIDRRLRRFLIHLDI